MTGTRPGPQSRRTKPIDTAPTAAVPIMVKITRRERFMGHPAAAKAGLKGNPDIQAEKFWLGKQKPIVSRHRAAQKGQPPPEKCDANACANPPKPPRVTLPEPLSEEVPDDERLEEASLLKKPLREPMWLPPDDEPRGRHPALLCKSDAIPGRFGSQVSDGISA